MTKQGLGLLLSNEQHYQGRTGDIEFFEESPVLQMRVKKEKRGVWERDILQEVQ